MDLQSSLYDNDLYDRCEDISDLNKSSFDKELFETCEDVEHGLQNLTVHDSHGYSPASQDSYFAYTGNPLLIQWRDDEDIEMSNSEIIFVSDNAYEPYHDSSFMCASQKWSMEWDYNEFVDNEMEIFFGMENLN